MRLSLMTGIVEAWVFLPLLVPTFVQVVQMSVLAVVALVIVTFGSTSRFFPRQSLDRSDGALGSPRTGRANQTADQKTPIEDAPNVPVVYEGTMGRKKSAFRFDIPQGSHFNNQLGIINPVSGNVIHTDITADLLGGISQNSSIDMDFDNLLQLSEHSFLITFSPAATYVMSFWDYSDPVTVIWPQGTLIGDDIFEGPGGNVGHPSNATGPIPMFNIEPFSLAVNPQTITMFETTVDQGNENPIFIVYDGKLSFEEAEKAFIEGGTYGFQAQRLCNEGYGCLGAILPQGIWYSTQNEGDAVRFQSTFSDYGAKIKTITAKAQSITYPPNAYLYITLQNSIEEWSPFINGTSNPISDALADNFIIQYEADQLTLDCRSFWDNKKGEIFQRVNDRVLQVLISASCFQTVDVATVLLTAVPSGSLILLGHDVNYADPDTGDDLDPADGFPFVSTIVGTTG